MHRVVVEWVTWSVNQSVLSSNSHYFRPCGVGLVGGTQIASESCLVVLKGGLLHRRSSSSRSSCKLNETINWAAVITSIQQQGECMHGMFVETNQPTNHFTLARGEHTPM